MAELAVEDIQQAMRELALTLAADLGKTIVKLVPGVDGVGITFAGSTNLPGVTVCADGKLNSDTLLELVEGLCRHSEMLACKMRRKDENGELNESGKDREALERERAEAPLADRGDRQADAEVHGQDQAAEEHTSEQD